MCIVSILEIMDVVVSKKFHVVVHRLNLSRHNSVSMQESLNGIFKVLSSYFPPNVNLKQRHDVLNKVKVSMMLYFFE